MTVADVCRSGSLQRANGLGAGLHIVQEGVPEAIPLEMCYLGRQESLAQLALLVEPGIPG